MKRVLVIGSSGAGKSTLSRQIGEVTGLPVIHLDKHHWRAGWSEPPKDVWRDQVAELVKGETWIMDGNFGGTMEQRLASCDTVVFLDLPRHVCAWRIIKRVVTSYGKTRPDLADGCPERVDIPFLVWVWNFPKRSRPRVLERIAQVEHRIRLYHLKTGREVEVFLADLREKYGTNGKG